MSRDQIAGPGLNDDRAYHRENLVGGDQHGGRWAARTQEDQKHDPVGKAARAKTAAGTWSKKVEQDHKILG